IKLNPTRDSTHPNNPTLQVVVNDGSEAFSVIEEDWIADLINRLPPRRRSSGVTALQESIDIVDPIETIVIQAQDDLVLAPGLKQCLVQHPRVTGSSDYFGNVILNIAKLVPEVQERAILRPKWRRQFE